MAKGRSGIGKHPMPPKNESQDSPADEIKHVRPIATELERAKKMLAETREYSEEMDGKKISDKDIAILEKETLKLGKSSNMGIRFSEKDLEKILDSGRFKSIYETHTSGGTTNEKLREEIENLSMSYSSDTPVTQRPIYGMLFDYKNVSEVNVSEGAGSRYNKWAGVVAIMKPEVKRFATVTFGDSLDNDLIPSPLLKPSILSYDVYKYRRGPLQKTIEAAKSGTLRLKELEPSISYAEVQIHNQQATVKNIEHLIFSKGAYKKGKVPPNIQKRLKKLGITWSYEGEDKIH